MKIVVLLNVGVLRQRTLKMEYEREYDFYKIIKIIKYALKIKLKLGQNEQKESCSVRRYLHRDISIVENRARTREIRIFKVGNLFAPVPTHDTRRTF